MDDAPCDSDVGKGSCRSVKGINLVDALVYCSDHLLKYGGHSQAAGVSLNTDKIDDFRAAINEYAENIWNTQKMN